MNLKEENESLRKTRTEMDDELHQLTENLFEVSRVLIIIIGYVHSTVH